MNIFDDVFYCYIILRVFRQSDRCARIQNGCVYVFFFAWSHHCSYITINENRYSILYECNILLYSWPTIVWYLTKSGINSFSIYKCVDVSSATVTENKILLYVLYLKNVVTVTADRRNPLSHVVVRSISVDLLSMGTLTCPTLKII